MSIYVNIFLSLLISFTIARFVIPKIIKVSRIKKLFDVPGHRSAATQVVPTLGGIAILSGFTIALFISTDNYDINDLKYMFAAIIAMFMIGLKDDIIGLSAKKKLLVQLTIAGYLVFLGHFKFTNLHGLLGFYEIGEIAGVIISIIAIVGIINAFNLIDGIDGLASGVSILIALVYGVWFYFVGDFVYSVTCFSLIGSLVAFFIYNVFGTENKIFMGDTGSLILGTIMAILTIHFNEYQITNNISVSHGLPAISLAILIVPIIDTIRVFVIRILQKRSPFSPDMNHVHHSLLKLTDKHLTTSLIIIVINAIFILSAFLLIDITGNNLLFILLIIIGFVVAGIPSLLLKWRNLKPISPVKNKSIYALSIFFRKNKN